MTQEPKTDLRVLWADADGAWALGDLGRDWTLSESDMAVVLEARGDMNRLRRALDLCSLRVSGAFISDWAGVPLPVVNFVGRQLDLDVVPRLAAPTRRATAASSRAAVREALAFTAWSAAQEPALKEWLVETATETRDVDSLLARACVSMAPLLQGL